MNIPNPQIQAVLQRYNQRTKEREHNERLIKEGRVLEADSPERWAAFLDRRGVSLSDAESLRSPGGAGPRSRAIIGVQDEPFALERVLGASDLMGVAFLERGLQVARSIGRIWMGVSGGRPIGFGTGFMVSPRLLLTNHHVLGDLAVARSSLVEFDFQLGFDGNPFPTTSFTIAADEFHMANAPLDYAMVAVQPTSANGAGLRRFGWNPLIEQQGKAVISQWLNIIQHPNGEPKQLCLRENQLVDVLDDFIHYKTDTAPGSSGSPVYNDRWEVVGLHHSGVPATNAAGQMLATDGSIWRRDMGEQRIKWVANEGARVSKILAHLRSQPMNPSQRRLFDEVFSTPPAIAEREQAPSAAALPPAVGGGKLVCSDGVATWNIPLSISVRIGGDGTVTAAPIAQPSGGSADLSLTRPEPVPPATAGGSVAGGGASEDERAILEAAARELGQRADVVGVRLGYVFNENQWITDQRALVVTVRQKRAPAELREAGIGPLPQTFKGLPIQVSNPTLVDLVRQVRDPRVAEAAFADGQALLEEITYFGPPGASLPEVNEKMRVLAQVSPDAGWPVLRDFLGSTKRSLVVGMYDFGAPHIADAVEAAGGKRGFRKLILVMQKGESVGEGTKADDLKDTEVVKQLSKALGNKFKNAWVKKGPVSGWIASSYHIKVAVRDQEAFWLSSGNWQSSNQPNAEPLAEKPLRRVWLDKHNRDWHAVVEHPGLAKTFEQYLEHDFTNNGGTDAHEALDLPDLLLPEALLVPETLERTGEFEYFPPFDEDRVFKVQPLLTPDNYHAHTLALVKSAQDELLIQNQTFKAPGPSHDKLRELIDAVLERQRAGVKVRIIFRLLMPADARAALEGLKERGFDMDSIKIQPNCHTKGIIVDRSTVLLGSQNWSNDGVSVNRDASLIFFDKPLAKYFAKIFEHDWENLAQKSIGRQRQAVEFVGPDQATPDGMVRFNWKDYLEML
ncbi:MAG TPA: phospholipase D-like domain-containing protein [Chthoniobacterales bacterium]|nr:phospholipase D-like domain-containing protein [Chthoniobacterales bacterium]